MVTKSNSIPIVDYRFGDLYWITEFVTPDNASVQDIKPKDAIDDNSVDIIASIIKDNFSYPSMKGLPTADGQLLRFHKSFFRYQFKKCVRYMWSFPSETLHQAYGICTDTSNLACSILLPFIPAEVCLGEVRTSKDDKLVGLHAWVQVKYRKEPHVFETTIHKRGANNLITTKGAYNRFSDWAKQGNIYYVMRARYNNYDYFGDTNIIANMCMPAKALYGRTNAYKAWKVEEQIKEALISRAWNA